MEKFSRSKRYNLISLFTFLVIAITFGYYYFFYVSSRESQFNEKAFRVIENIGKNVEKKHDNYYKNVSNALTHIKKYTGGLNNVDSDSLQNCFKYYHVPSEIKVLDIVKHGSWRMTKMKEKFLSGISGNDITMIIDNVMSSTTVYCKFPSSSLLENTLRKDFFKKFIVISQKAIEGGDNSEDYQLNIIHSDIPLIINHRVGHNSLDTTLFSNGALSSTRLIHVNFNNNEHNLYMTPVDMGNETTLYIGGIVEKNVFRKSTFGLQPVGMAIIITVLILLILSLPFLKLYLLSEDERLNTEDAVFSFISIVVGSAFVFMLMLNWQSQDKNSKVSQRNLLHGYTNKIENELKNEIRESLTLLDKFDKLLINGGDSLREVIKIDSIQSPEEKNQQSHKGTDNNEFKYIPETDEIVLDSFEIDTKFKYDRKIKNYKPEGGMTVFWTNKNGDQLVKWRNISNTPRANVKKRAYFNKVIDGNMWMDTNLSQKGFYMQSIFSWTDGHNYMMFSKKSENNNNYTNLPPNFKKAIKEKIKDADALKPDVIVIARKLSSLKDLLLPSNISYMLIDQYGKVLYHQTKSKTLQENLLNETGFNQELITALQTHIDTFFTESYNGIKQSFYVKPVGKLPIYLVTSVNAEHERITDIQSLALSSLIYLLFIIMLIAQIGVFVLVNRRSKTRIEGRNLLFCWFWPDKRKREVYKALSVYLLLTMIIFFGFKLNANIFISLSFFSLLATFVLFVLKWHHDTCESNPTYRNVIYLLLIMGLNVLLFISSCNSGLSPWIYVGYFLFIGLSCFFYLRIKWQFVEVDSFSEQSVIQGYRVFVFLLVLSLGLFPVISFYSKSYNLEKELYIRSMQLDLAKNLAILPQSSYSTKFELAQKLNGSIIKIDTNETNKKFSKCKISDSIEQVHILSKSELEFIKKLRFTYDSKMYNSASIDFLQCDSSRLYNWGSTKDYTILCDQQLDVNLKSRPDRFKLFHSGIDFMYIILMIVGFLAYCFVFFFSVQYWSSKIFLLGLVHKKKKNEFELILNSFKFIYLISLPHSGVKRYLHEKFKNAHTIPIRECEQEDFVKNHLSWIKVNRSECVILYDSDSYTEQLLKSKTILINELIRLLNKKGSMVKKLILVSNTHPSYKVKKIKGKNGDDTTGIDQYLNVLGNFKRVFFPFGFVNEYVKEEKNEELIHLFNECDYEDSRSWSNWKSGFSKDKFSEESVLNVQSLSQIQYFSIWNGLEKREQYLVYDLAQDGLANYKNMGVINNLISKGILKYNNMQLELFNSSFNNFVLTNIDREESLQIEHESKKSGNWSNLQLPIIMIIFALFAFLFITQQDVFNDIIAWLGTAMISLPLLLRSLSSLSILKFGKS